MFSLKNAFLRKVYFKSGRSFGSFKIEDFLVNEEWRSLLSEEFDKAYFKRLNQVLSVGYQKEIVRPKKELVFNALNKTKLNGVIFKLSNKKFKIV